MTGKQIAIGLIAALLAATAHAEPKTVEQRLEELDQEIRILKRQRELEQEAAVEKAKKTPLLQADDKGFGFKSADGAFTLRLRGYVQADARFFLDDDANAGTDQFVMRRVRPIIEGTLFNDFAFRIMPEFGGSSTSLQDGYLEWRKWKWLQVRAGQFKVPVSLERLQSGTDTLFVERGYPTGLAPNRDIGFQIGGSVADGVFEYAAGVFNGIRDGASATGDNDDDKSIAGRIFFHPFKKTDVEALQGFGFGVGASYGQENGTATSTGLPTFNSPGQNRVFTYITSTNAPGAVVANGTHWRLYPQAYYYWGRLGVLGEYVLSNQEISRGATFAKIENEAWQVAASFLLTDDQASFRGVSPKKPLNLKEGTWGALEIVGRFGVLDIDDAAFPTFASINSSVTEATSWAVGLNWYLNKNVRAYLNYEQTAFDGGAASGADRADEKALFSRLQISF